MQFHCFPFQRLFPVVLVAIATVLAGCTTLAPYRYASFNEVQQGAAPPGARNTFKVDGSRGNEKVLMFLSLSGGGSRAAYLSAETMLALQSRLEVDLLAEVDVVSSVSGGSLAAAYFVASRDTALSDPRILAAVRPLLNDTSRPLPALALNGDGQLVCAAPLSDAEVATLRRLLPAQAPRDDAQAVEQLCLSARYPLWSDDEVRSAMGRNYLTRWIGNWFWPANVLRYWTTSFDRSDIMAQTLANNLFSRRGAFGGELALSELNPTRPFLLINATNATSQWHTDGTLDDFPFGSVFTFTHDDFIDRLCSDAAAYPLARAVMGSSSFPLVFATMSLRDYRPSPPAPPSPCLPPPDLPKQEWRYQHVFDGGNSDNLGLRSVKRALLQMEVEGRLKDYDRVIVLLIDAFTLPSGAARDAPDPRSLLSLLVDTNVSDAVDSLLQTNRDALMGEFVDAELRFERDCDFDRQGLRQLPVALCQKLRSRTSQQLKSPEVTRVQGDSRVLNLREQLVFFHFGFADVEHSGAEGIALRRELDRIPTSFQISADDRDRLRRAVSLVIQPQNPCIRALTGLVRPEVVTPQQVRAARETCNRSDARTDTTPPAPR